jgi:hypothetical protein
MLIFLAAEEDLGAPDEIASAEAELTDSRDPQEHFRWGDTDSIIRSLDGR